MTPGRPPPTATAAARPRASRRRMPRTAPPTADGRPRRDRATRRARHSPATPPRRTPAPPPATAPPGPRTERGRERTMTTLTPVLSRSWDADQAWTLAAYQRDGGYEALRTALAMAPADIITMVKDSGLRGRGGAGFP